MANFRRGEYPVKISGIPFTLKFDMNAFAELEGAMGEPLHAILEDAESKLSFRFIRAALYAALCHDKRIKGKWTLERAGNMVTVENAGEIAGAITKALISAMTGKDPDALEATKDEPTEQANGAPKSPFEDSIGESMP